MAFPPVPVRSWAAGLLPNQRITFTTLTVTMGSYITGITNQKIAKGYTCSGSSNGVTAAMDGVNRCTTPAGFAVQGANAGASQSWIVTRAANGAQTLFTYQGATADVARVSCSPGGLFVAAGTPTQQPTATDELVGLSGVTIIGSAASNDRVFTVWVDSAANNWRAAIFRLGILAGPLMGVELFDSSPLSGPTISPSVWMFFHQFSQVSTMANRHQAFSPNAAGGLCRTSGNAQTQLGGAVLVPNGSFTNDSGLSLSANGGFPACRSCGLWSTSTGCVGNVGSRVDWYDSSDPSPCGALTSGNSWVLLNASSGSASGGFYWPWDGTTTSCVTS